MVSVFRHALAAALLAPFAAPCHAQLFKLTREQLVEITADNPFERFPDGRPKIPERLIERAKGLSAEEVWAVLPGKGYKYQWADGFTILHPDLKLVGRAFTVQFMPTRPDIMGALTGNAAKAGIARYNHQHAPRSSIRRRAPCSPLASPASWSSPRSRKRRSPSSATARATSRA